MKASTFSRPKVKPQKASPRFRMASAAIFVTTNGSGKEATANCSHRLSDGSRLTDAANELLLEAIASCASRESSSRVSGSALNGLIGHLYVLIQWMLLNNIYRFADLRQSHCTRFMVESASGLDRCIRASQRVAAYLEDHHKTQEPNGTHESLRPAAVFIAVGIPPTYMPRLNYAVALIRNYNFSHVLPKNITWAKTKLTTSAILSRAHALQLLWKHRDNLADPLTFDPFPNGPWLLARKYGADTKRTRTIPTSVATRYVVGAIVWVVDLANPLLKLRDAIEISRKHSSPLESRQAYADALDSFNSHPSAIKHGIRLRGREKGVMQPRTALQTMLPVACQTIIHTFTGRRAVEVESMRSDSIKGTARTGRWITSYIAKRGLHDEPTPCPELVALAVETMRKLGGLFESDSRSLWMQAAKPDKHMRLEMHFNAFADRVGAREFQNQEGGKPLKWNFARHQFRRFFAIVYVWLYDDPSLLALQHHLRHIHWWLTLVYVRDAEIRSLVSEQMVGLTAHKMREALSGQAVPVGPFGKLVHRAIERMQGNVQLVSSDKMHSRVMEWLADRKVQLSRSPWGFCACTSRPSNLKRAACQRDANQFGARDIITGAPDPRGSDEVTCSECHFFYTDASRATHWKDLSGRLTAAAAATMDETLMREQLRQRSEKVIKFIQKNFPQIPPEGASHA